MASSKLMSRASVTCGCRKPSQATGMWLLFASIAGLLLLGSTYTDVSSFYSYYSTSMSKNLHGELQRGTNTEANLQQQSQGIGPSPAESIEDISTLESGVPGPSSISSGNLSTPLEDSGLNDNAPVESPVETNFQPEESVMPGGDEAQNSTKNSNAETTKTGNKRCDISRGRWVYDETYPLYRSRNCPFVDGGFRCEENGRPDLDFMHWRWQPQDCDLPRFDPVDMLQRLRNQRLVFVGDSLGRNQWESLLCMLAEGVHNKSRIFETSGEPITKHTGHLVFRFQDYNCTVEYYRDPFLVPQTRPPRNSPANVTNVLKIDRVSWSVSKWWPGASILVLNSGHWWSNEKIFRGGGQFQVGDKLTTHGVHEGFQVAMKTWAAWIDENLDPETTQVFFRSYASVHFRGGTWSTGGRCDQEVRPLTDAEVREMQTPPWTNPLIVNAIHSLRRRVRRAVEFLDITPSTDYRADSHGALYTRDVALYGLMPRRQQDCSHFCLPGVPDTWNEFLYATLLARGQGVWGAPKREAEN